MIISLSRSGGFTGIPRKITIDTTKLPSDEAKKIEDLVGVTNISKLVGVPDSAKASAGQADRFQYTISIKDAAVSHTVSLDEKSLSPQMRELIGLIQESSGS